MELFKELKQLVLSLEGDVTKFYEKGNRSAGVRVRKGLQDIKSLSQALRVDISNTNKETTK